jgi:uncharacterized YccA/Bax inhibitor family protein
VRSSNPVLTRLGQAAGQRGAGNTYNQVPPGQNPFQYGQQYPQQGYGYPPAPPAVTGQMMSLDDVVVRTVMLLALTGVAGGLSWVLIPDTGGVETLALFGSLIAGLVLGLVIAFMRVTNPAVIALYALVQGVLLGVVSRWFEAVYPGIVMQAVLGTFAIFFVMAALYKLRVLRATPRFAKFVIGALIAFVLVSALNFVVYLIWGGEGLGLVDTQGSVSPLAWLFAGIGIVIGALTFILDFAEIENSIRYGLPEKYAWYCAFGLLVGLIFLYWQVLRLLSYLRR